MKMFMEFMFVVVGLFLITTMTAISYAVISKFGDCSNNTPTKSTNTTIGILNISEEIGECTDGDTIAVSINNDEMHIRFYTTPMKLSSKEKLYIVDRY